MPFAAPTQLDDQNDPNKKAQQGGGVNVSGTSTSFATNVPGQDQGSSQKQSGSGQYTNIQSYLDANKDQSAGMADQVANKITDTGTAARNQIGSATNDFNSSVDKGTIGNLAGAKTDAAGIVDYAKGINNSQSFDDQAAGKPAPNNKLSNDQLSRFKEVSTAQYKGPQDFASANLYSPTNDAVQKSDQYSKLSESDPGRFQLLDEVFKRPDYNQGQKQLDNLLINSDAGTKQKLIDARGAVSDVDGLFSKAQADAMSLAQQRAAQTDDARNSTLGYFNTNRDQRTNDVQNELDNVKNHWADEYNNYAKLLGDYKGGELNLNKDQASKLGVNQGDRLFNLLNGVDPKSYLKLNTYDPSKVISKDEQAQLTALDQLGAQAGLQQTNRYTDPSLAGTQNLQSAFDGSLFGQRDVDANKTFNNFAANDDITGYGTGKASYDNGWGNRGDVTSDATATQNLQKFLDGVSGTTNVSGSKLPDLSQAASSPYVASAILGQILSGSDFGGAKAGASGSADYYARQYAANDLYSKILAALEGQGYGNRITVGGQPINPTIDPVGPKGIPVKLPTKLPGSSSPIQYKGG